MRSRRPAAVSETVIVLLLPARMTALAVPSVTAACLSTRAVSAAFTRQVATRQASVNVTEAERTVILPSREIVPPRRETEPAVDSTPAGDPGPLGRIGADAEPEPVGVG